MTACSRCVRPTTRVASDNQFPRPSDTILNYTWPGLDECPAFVVVGDADAHLCVDGGLVGGVGVGERGSDVAE
jgi:hypothetical protein